ncbi:MAG: hypothetical protein IT162_18780 [Bryobacterales bacterium]|nr:hypothetical protein [Bryobacterales bacterium]
MNLPALARAAVRHILWIDCGAAAVAGVAVLSLASCLSGWYRLPVGLIQCNGLVNLAYASYSFSLARRRHRPLWAIVLLAAGNLTWFAVCMAVAAHFASTASFFGLAHWAGEGGFVATLAAVEWTQRHRLSSGG